MEILTPRVHTIFEVIDSGYLSQLFTLFHRMMWIHLVFLRQKTSNITSAGTLLNQVSAATVPPQYDEQSSIRYDSDFIF